MVGNRWCPVAAGSPGGIQQITFFLLPFISSTRQRQSKGAKSCLISAFFCRRLMVKVFSRDSLDTVLLTMLDFTSFPSGAGVIEIRDKRPTVAMYCHTWHPTNIFLVVSMIWFSYTEKLYIKMMGYPWEIGWNLHHQHFLFKI